MRHDTCVVSETYVSLEPSLSTYLLMCTLMSHLCLRGSRLQEQEPEPGTGHWRPVQQSLDEVTSHRYNRVIQVGKGVHVCRGR